VLCKPGDGVREWGGDASLQSAEAFDLDVDHASRDSERIGVRARGIRAFRGRPTFQQAHIGSMAGHAITCGLCAQRSPPGNLPRPNRRRDGLTPAAGAADMCASHSLARIASS
jgi:hypothetical protein